MIACVGEIDLCRLVRQPGRLGDHRNPFALFSSNIEASGAHALTLGSDWQTFARSTFSKSTLRRLKEKERQLARAGELTFCRHDDPVDKAKRVAEILQWQCQQLSEQGSRNAFADRRSPVFLARAACECGEAVEVFTLALDGRPLAGIVALATARGPLIYLMAFAPGPLSRRSPGQILLHWLMREMIERRQSVLDFSVGDEPYKLALCDTGLEMRQTVRAYSWKGAVVAAIIRLRLRLKRRIKPSVRLMKVLRAGNKWLGRVMAELERISRARA